MPKMTTEQRAEVRRKNAEMQRILSCPRTDDGNAQALLDHYRHDLLAVEGTRNEWLIKRSGQWVRRRTGDLTAEFERAVSRPLRRATVLAPEDKGLSRWARSCGMYWRMIAGIRRAHKLAQTPERSQTITREARAAQGVAS